MYRRPQSTATGCPEVSRTSDETVSDVQFWRKGKIFVKFRNLLFCFCFRFLYTDSEHTGSLWCIRDRQGKVFQTTGTVMDQ